MKKIFAMILCIVLMFSVSVTAFAAGAEVALTPSSSEVKQGDTVTISMSINGASAFRSMGLTYDYDKAAFEFVSGSWKFDSALLKDVKANEAAVALSASATKTGEFFTLVLKAKADAAISTQTVTVGYRAKNGNPTVAEGTVTKSLKIVCKAHKLSAWKVTAAATCTAAGSQERKCETAGCDFVEKQAIKALGHKFGAYSVTTAATCTTAGVETAKCSVCNTATTKAIAALGHKYGAWNITKAATCTEKGVKESKCANCGDVKKADVALKAHDFENPVLVKEATISTTGLMEGKCKNCSKTTSQVIPCSAKDEDTGINFEANAGVFAEGAQVSADKVADTTTVADALKEVSGKVEAYKINSSVQPTGTFKATFNVPADFGKNIAVYFVAEDGAKETVSSTLSEDGKTVTAEISKAGTYAIADLDVAATVEDDKPVVDDADKDVADVEEEGNNYLWLILLAAALLIIIIIVIIILAKKKKDQDK